MLLGRLRALMSISYFLRRLEDGGRGKRGYKTADDVIGASQRIFSTSGLSCSERTYGLPVCVLLHRRRYLRSGTISGPMRFRNVSKHP